MDRVPCRDLIEIVRSFEQTLPFRHRHTPTTLSSIHQCTTKDVLYHDYNTIVYTINNRQTIDTAYARVCVGVCALLKDIVLSTALAMLLY